MQRYQLLVVAPRRTSLRGDIRDQGHLARKGRKVELAAAQQGRLQGCKRHVGTWMLSSAGLLQVRGLQGVRVKRRPIQLAAVSPLFRPLAIASHLHDSTAVFRLGTCFSHKTIFACELLRLLWRSLTCSRPRSLPLACAPNLVNSTSVPSPAPPHTHAHLCAPLPLLGPTVSPTSPRWPQSSPRIS